MTLIRQATNNVGHVTSVPSICVSLCADKNEAFGQLTQQMAVVDHYVTMTSCPPRLTSHHGRKQQSCRRADPCGRQRIWCSIHAERLSSTVVCLPILVLIAQVVFILERGKTFIQRHTQPTHQLQHWSEVAV